MGGFCPCYTAPLQDQLLQILRLPLSFKTLLRRLTFVLSTGANQFSALICFRLSAKLLQGENSPFGFCLKMPSARNTAEEWMSNKQSGRAPDSPFHHFRIDYVLSSASRWISSMPKAPPMCNLIGGLLAVTSLCAGCVNAQCYLTQQSGGWKKSDTMDFLAGGPLKNTHRNAGMESNCKPVRTI